VLGFLAALAAGLSLAMFLRTRDEPGRVYWPGSALLPASSSVGSSSGGDGAGRCCLLVAPVFFDPHVCQPPSTANLIGREMDFECRCGRRWRLEHYLINGEILGASWILL
jgi:hypothetical protein